MLTDLCGTNTCISSTAIECVLHGSWLTELQSTVVVIPLKSNVVEWNCKLAQFFKYSKIFLHHPPTIAFAFHPTGSSTTDAAAVFSTVMRH